MSQIMRMIYLAVGAVFLVLGILGFFLPILQGILFTIVGLYFLSKGSKRVAKIFEKLKQRFPEQFASAEKFKDRITSMFSWGKPGDNTK
jgi:uncharacterized membrane protein YbaN (DUF454 family)